MSTYSKDSKPSGGTGKYVTVTKGSKFNSGLFIAACITMFIGVFWMLFALTVWGIPWMWGEALSSYSGWGWGELAILLTGFALYPWCYSTLFFTWAFWGMPNEARAAEQIGGIHLTHIGLLLFWLCFVGSTCYTWWGGMFGIGMEPEGWYWALFVQIGRAHV